MIAVRSRPCTVCPYKTDTPPGVWARDEYDKLRPYDAETWAQPPGAFRCHASPEAYCNGWAIVHTSRGHQYDLLALRINPPDNGIPEPTTELFTSGNQAADHGLTGVEDPPPAAEAAIKHLLRHHRRIVLE